MKQNIILMADSYKASHWLQYPQNTTGYFGYIEARGNDAGVDSTVFFGLQMFIKKYLQIPFTQEDINEAEEFFKNHGEPFNKEGWEYILKTYGGYIPVTIKAVPEGSVIPLKNVLCTVECTDPKCFWVGSYIETMLLRAVWYPTTVATNSRECKKVIYDYLQKTSEDPDGAINFKLHDFGGRGVSSSESAEIGGAAHLVNFMGSDTVEGIRAMNTYYNGGKMSAFSIPAAEHSTITSWGKDNEVDAYRNMLKQYGKKDALFACVSDSYDIYNAVENLWGGVLKDEVIASGATLVVRPDSGDPTTVVRNCIEILGDMFGYTVNKKGFKVLNYVRVIQGDGININTIKNILGNLYINGWSADNIAFGMGGALLQQLNRDTFQFAMKCSAIRIGDEWKDVSKNPITDSGKKSKGGRLSLFMNPDGKYVTSINPKYGEDIELLKDVYINGVQYNHIALDEVRANAKVV